MNGLQSGSPSGQLAPQAYKNSIQNANIQNTYDRSAIQQSVGLSNISSLPTSGTLRVVGNSQASVLSASTGSYSNSESTVISKQYNYFPIIMVGSVSVVLALYFIRRYLNLASDK